MPDVKNEIASITLYHGSDHIIEKPVFGKGNILYSMDSVFHS